MSDRPNGIGCPFVGLQPFREEHREYFFGREKDQRILIANVLAARLTVLYGASGVGKSSVLMAGVVPQLRRERPRIPVVVFRDWVGEDFGRRLARACIEAAQASAPTPLSLREDMPLDELLRACAAATRQTVLIILDQFEEYFLYHDKATGPESFEAQFARAVNREDVDAGFLISLREDSLARLDRFQERIPDLLSNRLRIRHLDEGGAEQAIRRPLAVWNDKAVPGVPPVAIEDGLVTALIEQVRAGRVSVARQSAGGPARNDEGLVEAPFLQLVLTRLWAEETNASSHTLRLATFTTLGGAQEIVRRHLRDVMDKLDGTSQAVCATFFDRLVTPSGGKFACAREDLAGWAGELSAHVPEVLETLSAQRILRTTASSADRPDATYYEIYHDVLAPAVVDWRNRYVEQREQQEADRERREATRRRRQRRLLIAASAFALITVPGWLFSYYQQTRAEANALAARVAATAQTDALQALDDAIAAAQETRRFGLPATPSAENALRQAIRATGYEPRTLAVDDWVWSVAYGPGGDRVAAGTRDQKALLWRPDTDAAGSAPPALVVGDDVRKLVFLGENRLLLSEGKTVHLRDPAQPETDLATFEHGSLIYGALAVSADGRRLATAGQGREGKERNIKVWDVHSASPTPLAVIDLDGAWAMGLAFSPDGCCLATVAVERGQARRTHTEVWSIATGKRVLSVPNGQPGDAVRFTPDGKKIVVAARDNRIRIFKPARGELDEMLAADAHTGRERSDVPWDVDTLAGHADRVREIAINTDGSRIASAGGDRTVRIWDGATGESLLLLKGHRGYVEGVAFSPDGRRVVSGGRDKQVKVWDISRHTAPLHGVAFSPDGTRVATASADGTAKIWDVSGDLPVLKHTLTGHEDEVYRVAFDPRGEVLATASFDRTVRLWNVATGQPLGSVGPHWDQLRHVAFSPDGAYLATASADGHARLFNWRDGSANPEGLRIPKVRSGKYSQMRAVAFHPRDGTLLTASSEGLLRRWTTTGEAKGEISLPGSQLLDMALSRDGSRVAALSASALHLWTYDDLVNSRTGSYRKIDLPATTFCHAISFGADSTQIAAACDDAAVRVYALPSGEVVKTLSMHSAAVSQVAYSADGQRIATAGADRSLSVTPLAAEAVYHLAQRLRQARPGRAAATAE